MKVDHRLVDNQKRIEEILNLLSPIQEINEYLLKENEKLRKENKELRNLLYGNGITTVRDIRNKRNAGMV